MNGRVKLVLIIAAIGVLVVSSLVIYANISLNPIGSKTGWQRPLENFATGLAADQNGVYTDDSSGYVSAFSAGTGASTWNSSAQAWYFSSGLIVTDNRVYGGTAMASVGCLDKATGRFKWSFEGDINTDLWVKHAPDEIIVSDKVAASVDGGVSVHDITTGAFLWQASRPYGYPEPPNFGNLTDLSTWWVGAYPIGGNPFEGNYVYVLSGNFSQPYISKFNFQTQTFLWNSSITLTDFPIVYPETGPAIAPTK